VSYDFLNSLYREPPITSDEFGLIDAIPIAKTDIDITNTDKWVATVKNSALIPLTFTAIDGGVVPADAPPERCDGMLASDDHLFFIELKRQRDDWIPKAKAQLESTIKLFIESHGQPKQKRKKAYICNIKHPKFHILGQAEKRLFFAACKFRLDIQAEIVVKKVVP
jgi:hypothetical protein